MNQEILKRAIVHWGPEAQLRKTAEECLELALAITHYLDGRGSIEQVAEECADVLITAQQVRTIIGATRVDDQIRLKINRLNERMRL